MSQVLFYCVIVLEVFHKLFPEKLQLSRGSDFGAEDSPFRLGLGRHLAGTPQNLPDHRSRGETPCGEAGGAIGQADLRRAAIATRHDAISSLPPVCVLDVVKNNVGEFGAIRPDF